MGLAGGMNGAPTGAVGLVTSYTLMLLRSVNPTSCSGGGLRAPVV
jgi:hypothetical protein